MAKAYCWDGEAKPFADYDPGESVVFPLVWSELLRRGNERGDEVPPSLGESDHGGMMDWESAAELIELYAYEGGVDSDVLAQWFGFRGAGDMLHYHKYGED